MLQTSCVLLAAGLSSRFGSPKALAVIDGQTVMTRVQQALIASGINEIIVVLGAHSEEIKAHLLKHTKIRFVYNKDYKLGQTSSFQCGLAAVSRSSQGIFLFPVDYPFVRTQTLDLLKEDFQKTKAGILIPVYQNRKGHPPLFPEDLKEAILALSPSEGLNTFLHEHGRRVRLVEVTDPGVVKTFNTPEELEHIRREYQNLIND